MRGGAFFNGKEGRDDFRTKAQAPLADQNSGRAIASPATSLALMQRARAWEWDKDPLFARGGQGSRKISYNIKFKLVLLNQYSGKNTLKAILIW